MIEPLKLYLVGVGVEYGSRRTLVSTSSHIRAMTTPNVRALYYKLVLDSNMVSSKCVPV